MLHNAPTPYCPPGQFWSSTFMHTHTLNWQEVHYGHNRKMYTTVFPCTLPTCSGFIQIIYNTTGLKHRLKNIQRLATLTWSGSPSTNFSKSFFTRCLNCIYVSPSLCSAVCASRHCQMITKWSFLVNVRSAYSILTSAVLCHRLQLPCQLSNSKMWPSNYCLSVPLTAEHSYLKVWQGLDLGH